MGSCLFRKEEARVILSRTLMQFHGNRVRHHAWVIMPNPVHVLFIPVVPVAKLVQGWKASSARLLGKKSVWQRNYRDTLIRDARHFGNAWRYVLNNPLKAGLREDEYTLWEEREPPNACEL